MKRVIVYIALSLSLVAFTSSTKTESHTLWKNPTQLSWKDFKSTPDDSSPFKALTAWGIGYDITYQNSELTINIECYFIPEKSWVKEGHENDYLLNHVSQHFNIAEIYTRKFREEIDDYKKNLKKVDQSTGKEIGKIYNRIMKECHAEQQRYDKETHHSLEKDIQAKWDKYIQKELSKKD